MASIPGRPCGCRVAHRFLTSDSTRRQDLTFELGKGLIQLVVVVMFGAALKLLVDRYQDHQERAEQERQRRQAIEDQNRQFRQDKYDRLVQATNELRRVPILIDANRSVKTWSEQMLAVINAGLELRMLKHQIYSSRELNEPPFPNHAALAYLFELMYQYTDWVTADFADRKKELSEVQRQAENKDLPDEERERRQLAVWDSIKDLRSVADMRRDVSDEERKRCRAAIMDELEGLPPDKAESSAPPSSIEARSWVGYQEAESLALESITQATLAKRANSRKD